MRSPWPASVMVFAAALSISFWIGGYLVSNETRTETASPTRTRSETLSALPVRESKTAPISATGRARIDTVCEGKSPAEHMAMAADWDSVTDRDEILELLNHTHQLPGNLSEECAQAVLLNNLLKVDAAAAIRWCSGRAPRLAHALAQTLVEEDLDSARVQALESWGSGIAYHLVDPVITGLADRDVGEAYAFIRHLEAARPNSVHREIVLKLARFDPQAMLVEAEKVGGKRLTFRRAAATAMVETNPSSAIAWLTEQEDRADLVNYVFGKLEPAHWEEALGLISDEGVRPHGWAAEHPEELLELAMTDRGAQFLTDGIARYAVSYLAGRQPEAFEAWRDAHGDHPAAAALLADYDRSKAEWNAAQVRPRTAAEFVVADHESLAESFYALPESERGAVVDAVAEMPSEAAPKLIGSLTSHYLTLRPEQQGAILAAVNLEDAGTRSSVEQSVQQLAGEWGRFMPQDAFAWASGLEDGEIRNSAMKTVVNQWRTFDPEAAAVAAPEIVKGLEP